MTAAEASASSAPPVKLQVASPGGKRGSRSPREHRAGPSRPNLNRRKSGHTDDVLQLEHFVAIKTWQTKLRENIKRGLDSTPFQTLSTVCLLVALFAVDVAQLAGSQETGDIVLNVLLCVALVFFALELTLTSIAVPEYRMGFFFVMDLIGTLSLILDIDWILDALGIDLSEGNTDASLLRAARTARVGARAGRLTRAVRIIKVLRLQTVMNQFPSLRKFARKMQIEDDDSVQDVKPSQIGKKISEEISKKVAALVILMVLVVPTLSSVVSDQSAESFIRNFETLRDASATQDCRDGKCIPSNQRFIQRELIAFDKFYADDSVVTAAEPLYLSIALVANQTWHPEICKPLEGQPAVELSTNRHNCTWNWWPVHGDDKIRKPDHLVVEVNGNMVYALYNKREWNNEVALFNIVLTCAVVVVLLVFSVVFSMGMATLVVKPLERVMTVIHENTAGLAGKEEIEQEHELVNETDALERAIAKMTRVLNYVGGRLNNTGGGMLQDTLKNKDLDAGTQAYLQQYTTANAEAKKEGGSNQATPRDALSSDRSPAAGTSSELFLSAFGINKIKQPNAVESWDFNIFDYSDEQLVAYIAIMFNKLELIDRHQIAPEAFASFVQKINSGYHTSNPYHNFQHAVDVTHTVYRMLTCGENTVRKHLERLDVLSLMVAALAHDIDHPGLSNAFLISQRHPLAITYNDQSVLENRHSSMLYNILLQKESDIFASMDRADWVSTRKLIIHCILATDNQFHFKHMSELDMFLDLNSEVLALGVASDEAADLFSKTEDKQLLMDMMLHCCDISNPWKPWKICEAWTHKVREEFFTQGDLERAAGMPISPMMDRDTTGRGASSVNFAEFLVAPLLSAMTQIMPDLKQCMSTLCNNVDKWAKIWIEEMTATDESVPGRMADAAARNEQISKLESRLVKFMDKHKPKITSPSKKKSTRASIFGAED